MKKRAPNPNTVERTGVGAYTIHFGAAPPDVSPPTRCTEMQSAHLPVTAAGRFELALDLLAPRIVDDDGNDLGRDEGAGFISREQFINLVNNSNFASRSVRK